MLIDTESTAIVTDTVLKNIVIEEIVEGVLTIQEDQTAVDVDQSMNTVGPHLIVGPLHDMEVMNATGIGTGIGRAEDHQVLTEVIGRGQKVPPLVETVREQDGKKKRKKLPLKVRRHAKKIVILC